MARAILAVGAHMDDCENGVGGIMIDAARRGWRVVTVTVVSDFSTWQPTRGREEQVREDLLALAERFNYEKRFLDYPYHQVEPDIELKRKIAAIYEEVRPEVGFVHCTADHWPDHAAVGLAAKDALIFAHGLTQNLEAPRCPRIFAYNATPHQTIRFDPDFFYDVTPVMQDWLDLIIGTDCCLSGLSPEELTYHTVTVTRPDGREVSRLKCSSHGWLRLAQCVTWGHNAEAQFALGLEALWGPRNGRPLFPAD
jgi:LmbE family N-acetylglucosaminyl deacetylase